MYALHARDTQTIVINRIKALLQRGEQAPAASGEDRLRVAAAALMVEAARMDDDFGAAERAKIAELVSVRFDLNAEETESLLQAAEGEVDRSVQVFGFTRVVKDAFSHEDRVELMEMLWEVVYADGMLHDLEASLMRRVAGLLFVSDRENGDARKRAMARLGI